MTAILGLWLAMQLNPVIPLLPHQKRFMQSTTGVTALTGGYGSGKSTSCALKAILHTGWDPYILHAVCSPSYPMAKLTIIPSIFEVLEDWLQLKEGRDFDYNRTDHFFKMSWGGQLVVLSGENPKRLKGPNLGSFGIDEPGLQDHAVFKQARARVRHPKAKRPEVYLTGTPEDLNWYCDLVEGDLRPSSFTDIRAHSRDNIFLPAEFFSNMEESYTQNEIAAYMSGQFVNLNTSQAYHAFSTSNIIEKEEFGEPDKELPLLLGFDYNWNPNTAIVMQEVPDWVEKPGAMPGKKLIVFDEFHISGCSTTVKCERILEKYGPEFQYLIYQDASGDKNTSVAVSDVNQVRNAFANVNHRILNRPANPRRLNRLNSVNGRLCNSKGDRFIYITRNCKNLIDDLRKCNRDEYLSGHFADKARGHMGDCLGYPVEYRYPIIRQTNHSNKALIL